MTDITTSTLTNIDTTKRRILVVEDEEALAVGIRDAIEHAGYQVDVALDGNKAFFFGADPKDVGSMLTNPLAAAASTIATGAH